MTYTKITSDMVDEVLDELHIMNTGDLNYQDLLKFARYFYSQGLEDGFENGLHAQEHA